MKNLFFTSMATLCLFFLFSSCKKKEGDNKNNDPNSKKPFDIMSTKYGSWWYYKATDGELFYRYATGRDSIVEGLNFDYFYRIVETSGLKEENPEYFGKFADKYLSLIDLDGKKKNYITYVILKDNWYPGQKWTNTETRKIEGYKVDMFIESEVKSTMDVMVLNGKTYDSVILVHNDLKAKSVLMPTYVKCGVLDVWFKKGVGILQEKGDIDISPAGISLVSKTYEDYLLDYHIEP